MTVILTVHVNPLKIFQVPVTCNYVKLDVKPGGGMYEYEVKFNPQVDSVRDKREMLLDQQRATIGSATNYNGKIDPKSIPVCILIDKYFQA